jgi:DNA-binding XRE family transcriptional regulator
MDGWGRRLREVRRKWRLTQEQLAEAAGVSENTVRSWERDRKAPTHEYAVRVLQALRARGLGVALGRIAPAHSRTGAGTGRMGGASPLCAEVRGIRAEQGTVGS